MSDSAWRKAPTAKLDYSIDWTDWLGTAETISDDAWSIPAGITEVSSSESGGVCTVWLSGGAVGTVYTCRCTITTSQGRIDTRSLQITVAYR